MMRMTKKGFSLVELAIGLAVISVLVLAISFSGGIRDSARVQSAAGSVQALRTAAENYLASGKLNYTGMDVTALKTAKLLPDSFTPAKTNPWGGDFNIAPNAADNTRVDVALTGLTKINADKLTAIFNNSAAAVGFDEGSGTWSVTF